MIAYLEAMAMGCPVVASRRGAAPELVDHGQTGWLFDPDSENSLASTRQLCLRDRAKLPIMAREARVRAAAAPT